MGCQNKQPTDMAWKDRKIDAFVCVCAHVCRWHSIGVSASLSIRLPVPAWMWFYYKVNFHAHFHTFRFRNAAASWLSLLYVCARYKTKSGTSCQHDKQQKYIIYTSTYSTYTHRVRILHAVSFSHTLFGLSISIQRQFRTVPRYTRSRSDNVVP